MENKYSLGKVYEIVCNKTGKKYIGSTCEELLSQRLANHRNCFKRYKNEKKQGYTTSFAVLEGGDFYINLLEKVNATCKDELLARERHYINTIECVNKLRPLRKRCEYYKDNIVAITEKKSTRHICECSGKYRTDNKAHHLKTDKHINYMIEKDLKDKGVLIDLSTNEKIMEDYNKTHIHIGEEIICDLAMNDIQICICCGKVF
jgi:hypothetical protein